MHDVVDEDLLDVVDEDLLDVVDEDLLYVVAEGLLDVVDEDSGRLVRPSVLPTPTPDEPPALSTFCLSPVFTLAHHTSHNAKLYTLSTFCLSPPCHCALHCTLVRGL